MLLETDALTGAFWRYGFAIPLLLIFAFKTPFQIIYKNWKAILVVGVVGLFGFNFLFFEGMKDSSAINGALIMSLNPAVTLIISRIILKTTITKLNLYGISIAFLGVLILLLKGDLLAITEFHFTRGDGLIGLANIVFAFNHVMVKKYSSQIDSNILTTFSTIACFLAFAILVSFTSDISFNLSATYWLSALGMGVLGTSLAFLFWNYAVFRTGATQASIFINVVPISTAIFSVILGEPLHYYHFLSAIIVILGLGIMNYRELKYSFSG